MNIPKNPKDILKIVEIIGFVLFKMHKSKKNIITGNETLLPKLEKNIFITLFLNLNFWYYGSSIILSILLLKDVLHLSHENLDLVNKNKNSKNFPQPSIFPEKRVLSLHLSSTCSLNQYVVFNQKNKNNLSPIHISHGEIGQIIKKLEDWDHVLVDFSIDIPSRFQKLKPKFIADQARNEAILIEERI